jgi:FKBP-type peptidyl-prolyl cis-trans isomerase SlyD
VLKSGTTDIESMSENEQAEDVETETEDESVEADGIQDGDFVRLAYTLRTVEDDRVIDTTDKETAEANDLDTEEFEFEPRIVVIGAGHVFEAVDGDIEGKNAGDEGTVEIPATEAFGEYDPDQVRTISAEKIPEDDRYPGAHVTIDGESGHVETVIGGRSRVDFNHPLAGEDLEYDYEVLDVVDDREQQAEGLLGMHLEQVPDVWIETDEIQEEQVVTDPEDLEGEESDEPETEEVTVEKESLYIEATPQMAMNQEWMFQKQQIAQDLMDRLDLDRVIVQEVIEGGGMMGGMGGMMGGMGGEAGLEEALEDADVDADELVDELEGEVDAEELEGELESEE